MISITLTQQHHRIKINTTFIYETKTAVPVELFITIDELLSSRSSLIFIKLKDKSTFSILKSEWISIQRQLKLNKILK